MTLSSHPSYATFKCIYLYSGISEALLFGSTSKMKRRIRSFQGKTREKKQLEMNRQEIRDEVSHREEETRG